MVEIVVFWPFSLYCMLHYQSYPTSCVGETVTYVCTVASVVHQWRSASFDNSFTLAGASEDVTDANGFTFQTISLIDGILTSAVSVLSSSGLNGALIECEDVGGLGAEEQTTTAIVFGNK